MRRCPIKSCGQKIADRMFVCNYHWHRLPVNVRNLVSESFREYICEEISLASLRAITNQVLADYQGIPVEDVSEHEVAAAAARCRGCGCNLILATGIHGLLFALEEDESGDRVVIGGKEMLCSGFPAIYTRFKRHFCKYVAAAASNTDKVLYGKAIRPTCGDGGSVRDDARAG